MTTQPKARLTPEEYLAIERQAEYKSEYCAGEMFAMVSASRRHNLSAAKVLAALHAQLRKRPCTISLSDMKKSSPQVYTPTRI